MAAQPKKKHTRSRTGKRRAKWTINLPALYPCPNCGKLKLSHRACPHCGAYGSAKLTTSSSLAQKK